MRQGRRRSSFARAPVADGPKWRAQRSKRASSSRKNFQSLSTAWRTNRNGTGGWNGRESGL
jgi:hypothetical protein